MTEAVNNRDAVAAYLRLSESAGMKAGGLLSTGTIDRVAQHAKPGAQTQRDIETLQRYVDFYGLETFQTALNLGLEGRLMPSDAGSTRERGFAGSLSSRGATLHRSFDTSKPPKLEIAGGTTIDEASKQLADVARLLDRTVVADFNGTRLVAKPNDSADQVMAPWVLAQQEGRIEHQSPEAQMKREFAARANADKVRRDTMAVLRLGTTPPRPLDQLLKDIEAGQKKDRYGSPDVWAMSNLKHPGEIKAWAEHYFLREGEVGLENLRVGSNRWGESGTHSSWDQVITALEKRAAEGPAVGGTPISEQPELKVADRLGSLALASSLAGGEIEQASQGLRTGLKKRDPDKVAEALKAIVAKLNAPQPMRDEAAELQAIWGQQKPEVFDYLAKLAELFKVPSRYS